MDRQQAMALVSEHLSNDNLVKHSIATEAIMEALATRVGTSEVDRARWGIAGLLHDLDYDETHDDPERHGHVTAGLLEGVVDEEIVHAILSHAEKVSRESLMDKALYAADPTTGFIVAAALVRPEKQLASVEVRSLRKRWKEKAFARGASREQMATCADLGLERDDFLSLSLEAMQARSDEIGL